MAQEFRLDTHPGHSLHLLLFTDVENGSGFVTVASLMPLIRGLIVASQIASGPALNELVTAMRAGTLMPELAFFTASLVPATFPVLAAAHKALLAQSRNSLATRTLHSELIYNYSGSKHISESLRRWGINESSNYVLVARFDATADELAATRALVKGTEISVQELPKRANQSLIIKQYKITTAELAGSSLEDAITCRIAARDVL